MTPQPTEDQVPQNYPGQVPQYPPAPVPQNYPGQVPQYYPIPAPTYDDFTMGQQNDTI